MTTNDLIQVWNLSDHDQDGKLNEKEYTVAKFLIYARHCQQNLPDKLPDTLLAFLGDLGNESLPTESLLALNLNPPAPSAHPAAAPQSTQDKLPPLTAAQYMKYKETFDQTKDPKTAMVGGAEAFNLFTLSGLDTEVLAMIWQLADMNSDNFLNEMEFAVAMHLIHHRKNGGDIPNAVPVSLLNSAKELSSGAPSPATSSSSSVVSVSANSALLQTISSSMPPLNVPQIVLPDITIAVPNPQIPQFDVSPLNPASASDLADKFGIHASLISAYDPTLDIQRAQTEVLNSITAQQVLDQSSPDINTHTVSLEKLMATQRTLQDSLPLMTSKLGVVENQRQQMHTVMNEFYNQMTQAEQELQQQYQELVNLKAQLESYATTQVSGDVNALRQLRMQISQEQNEINLKFDSLRSEKLQIFQEIEKLKLENEQLNEEIQKISSTSVNLQMEQTNLALGIGSGTASGTTSGMGMAPGMGMGMTPGMGMGMGMEELAAQNLMDPRFLAMNDSRLMASAAGMLQHPNTAIMPPGQVGMMAPMSAQPQTRTAAVTVGYLPPAQPNFSVPGLPSYQQQGVSEESEDSESEKKVVDKKKRNSRSDMDKKIKTTATATVSVRKDDKGKSKLKQVDTKKKPDKKEDKKDKKKK
uniref:EF-hand domain-containing protein n=1 Tax=Arcella intermedia TaxID=1963864 RepID=A0A6B2KZ69_9EUKA